jgi:hypothetical protein
MMNDYELLALDMEVTSMHKRGTVIEDLCLSSADGSTFFASFDQVDRDGRYKSFADYAKDMIDYIIGGRKKKVIIVAHNGICHDFLILIDNLDQCGLTDRLSEVLFFDTLPFFRKLYPKDKVDMKGLCKRFNVSNKRAHSAKGDSDSLAEVLRSKQVCLDNVREEDLWNLSKIRCSLEKYTEMDNQQKQARHHMKYVLGKNVSNAVIDRLIDNKITIRSLERRVRESKKGDFCAWFLNEATGRTTIDTSEATAVWNTFKIEDDPASEAEDNVVAVKYPIGAKGIYADRLKDDGITFDDLEKMYRENTEVDFKDKVIAIFATRNVRDKKGNESLGEAFAQKKSMSVKLYKYFEYRKTVTIKK